MIALKENINAILKKVENDKERRKTAIDSKVRICQSKKFQKYWEVLPKVPGSQIHVYRNSKMMTSSKSKRLKIKSMEEECWMSQDDRRLAMR